MNIAVTGGKGFIGSLLVSKLVEEGHHVKVLSRHPSDPTLEIRGDLSDLSQDFRDFLKDAEVLFHCAGEVSDQDKMRAVHVDGTRRLAGAAHGKIKHWIQLSSVGAYGKLHSGLVNEMSPEKPVGSYEVTKTISDQIVTEISNAGGFALSIVRPSIVFGPTMTNNSLFSLISAVNKGMFFFIGKKGAIANYVPVENVIEALLVCLKNPPTRPQMFNLSADLPLESFISLISQELGKQVPSIRIPECLARVGARCASLVGVNILTQSRIDALTNRVFYDSSKIREMLDFKDPLSMEVALKKTVEAWKKRQTGVL